METTRRRTTVAWAALLALLLVSASAVASPKNRVSEISAPALFSQLADVSQPLEPHQACVALAYDLTAESLVAPKTAKEMGSELAGQAGRHRVSARTAGGKQIDIDLAGKRHYDKPSGTWIDTPHVHESQINVGPTGKISTSGKTTRPATKADIRTARKILERE